MLGANIISVSPPLPGTQTSKAIGIWLCAFPVNGTWPQWGSECSAHPQTAQVWEADANASHSKWHLCLVREFFDQ